MRNDIYSQSLLVIDMSGQILRLYTPFQVMDKESKIKYWVSKIVWNEEGIPYYQIDKKLISYNQFIIV